MRPDAADLAAEVFAETIGIPTLQAAGPILNPLLGDLRPWDRHAVVLLHPTAPGYREASQAPAWGTLRMDDGTLVLTYDFDQAVAWLRTAGYCRVAESFERDMRPGKLMVAVLRGDDGCALWLSREMHDGYDRLLDAVPDDAPTLMSLDGSPLEKAQEEDLGKSACEMAQDLAQAIANGAPHDDVVYVVIDPDCPVFGEAARQTEHQFGNRVPADRPFRAVMSRAFLVERIRLTDRTKIAGDDVDIDSLEHPPAGAVSMMHLTRDGFAYGHARLLVPASRDAS
jgi:hypothetical protein